MLRVASILTLASKFSVIFHLSEGHGGDPAAHHVDTTAESHHSSEHAPAHDDPEFSPHQIWAATPSNHCFTRESGSVPFLLFSQFDGIGATIPPDILSANFMRPPNWRVFLLDCALRI
jgi:hypothetical protein